MRMLTLLLAAGLAMAMPALAEDGGTPVGITREHTARMLDTLVERRDEFKAEPARLEAFIEQTLDRVFDREYSARLVLGQHGRGVPREQIVAFAEALASNLRNRYGQALLDFDPKIEVKVTGSTEARSGRIVRVKTEIVRRAGAPVPVDYVYHRNDDGWKVFDVIVEGVSYVQTYRNQFDEMLRSRSIAEVTEELRRGKIDAGG